MALVSCKDCGHQISKKAKTCPNCGAKNKKKLSIIESIGVLLVAGFVFLWVIASNDRDSKKYDVLSTISAKYQITDDALKVGKDAVFTVTNNGTKEIYDMKFECDYIGNSGTKLDSSNRTIYDSVMPGKTRSFKINMAVVTSAQATKSICRLIHAKVR